MTIIRNEKNELIPTRTVVRWRMCIDYRKLYKVIRKNHFPLPFIDQMLERLADQAFYCFLNGYSGYNEIVVDPKTKRKLLSHASLVFFPIGRCHLGFAMRPPLSNVVFSYFLIFGREMHRGFYG